jgi:hypothetical protein
MTEWVQFLHLVLKSTEATQNNRSLILRSRNSAVQFWGAAEILAICGMSGGGLDGYIKMSRAEVHEIGIY